MHNLYYICIYDISDQCIFILDNFISFPEASVLITWTGLFYTVWGQVGLLNGSSVFFPHTWTRQYKQWQ